MCGDGGGGGGTLLVTWFIIRSCEVVRLGGIRDDKLALPVGKEGAASAFMKQREVGGGGGRGNLTASLTVLGPSVPFAVL